MLFTLPTLAILLAAIQTASAYNCASHTYGTCQDNIVHWYDPDDGMICDPLDCGGGRAPPKTNVPCCSLVYKGTEACVTTPSYMPCFKKAEATTSPVAAPASTTAVVVYQSPPAANTPAPSTAAALSQPSTVASVQDSTTFQLSSAPQVTSPAPSTTTGKSSASIVASSASSAVTTSRAAQSGGTSTVSAATASNTSNAAGFMQRDSHIAFIGLVVGLFAGI